MFSVENFILEILSLTKVLILELKVLILNMFHHNKNMDKGTSVHKKVT